MNERSSEEAWTAFLVLVLLCSAGYAGSAHDKRLVC